MVLYQMELVVLVVNTLVVEVEVVLTHLDLADLGVQDMLQSVIKLFLLKLPSKG